MEKREPVVTWLARPCGQVSSHTISSHGMYRIPFKIEKRLVYACGILCSLASRPGAPASYLLLLTRWMCHIDALLLPRLTQ